jgi:hypothetical protein
MHCDLRVNSSVGRSGFVKSRNLFSGKHLATSATLFSIIAGSAIAYGLEPSDVLVFSKGPVSLRPQLSVSSEFNDNILFREQNVDGDFIHVLSPGFDFLVGDDLPESNHVKFGYRIDEIWYMDHSELDATQHRFGLSGRFGTDRTQIAGSDQLEFLSGTIGGGLTLNGQKVNRLVSRDVYRLDYGFSEKTGVYAGILHDATDFDNNVQLFDSQTFQGTLGFKWNLTSDTSVFGEIYYGETSLHSNQSRTDPPGKTYEGGFIGASGNFTPKLSGLVKVGYEFDQFEKTTIASSLTASTQAPVVESDLLYRFTERTSATFTYSRQQRVSVQFSRATFVADQITVGASSILGSSGRLRIDLGARFAFLSYDPSPSFAFRNDTLWGFTAAANWYFQTWFYLRLQYDMHQFRSDLPIIAGYDQNRISVGANVGF